MFKKEITNFVRNLDGLRDFVDLVSPFLDSKRREVLKKHASDFIPFMLAASKVNPDVAGLNKKKEADLRKRYGSRIVIRRDKKDSKSVHFSVTGEKEPSFAKAMTEMDKAMARVDLLYQNSLITLISVVESFFSQMLHVYFNEVPGILEAGEKIFSLSELKNFTNIEDAKSYLIEKKIEGIMRDGFREWIDFFKSKIQLSMLYLKPHMNELIEARERRNLLVHNGGIVNNIYLSKVAPELSKNLKDGKEILVSAKYLNKHIDLFERCCLLVTLELWKKLKADDDKRASILSEIVYKQLLSERWFISEGLSHFIMNDKKMPERDILVGKMNYWLSLKRQKGLQAIKKELESEDLTAKEAIFRLARLSLLDRNDDFYKLLPNALKSGNIDLKSLNEFPIFREIRDDSRFAKYSTEKPQAKKPEKSDEIEKPPGENKTLKKL